MGNSIQRYLEHIHELLGRGEFVTAMETYLHNDVELQEANDEPKKGKDFCIQFEKDFIENQLDEFVGYKVGNYAINGNHTYYDAVMTLKLNDGSTIIVEQVVKTEWKDGKIYKERYYHV